MRKREKFKPFVVQFYDFSSTLLFLFFNRLPRHIWMEFMRHNFVSIVCRYGNKPEGVKGDKN